MTILITGSEGYLMGQLIDRLEKDPEVNQIIGIDIREVSRRKSEKYVYVKHDVTQPLEPVLKNATVDVIIHAAWWFNPTHDLRKQNELDFRGTTNVMKLAMGKQVKQFIYMSSTTAYAPLPENPNEPPFLKEEDWAVNADKRKNTDYRYSRNKARVDEWFQEFAKVHPKMAVCWLRAAIVIGPNTRNVVSHVADSPFTFGVFMFRVSGYDPTMQYASEKDITNVIYAALKERWTGPINVSSEGTVKYSEVIKLLGRKELCLPAWLLYPFTELLWKLRIFKFPANLIDLIRYPWVADISKLRTKKVIQDSSEQALRDYAIAKNR